MNQPKKTRQEIETIVNGLQFMDRKFHLLDKGDGYLLQMSYYETDVENPNTPPVLQSTRKWYVSPFMSESEIVETAWACACRSMLHVASEHFRYLGSQVYSQHFAVAQRIALCNSGAFDCRIPPSIPPNVYDSSPFQVDDMTWNIMHDEAKKPTD